MKAFLRMSLLLLSCVICACAGPSSHLQHSVLTRAEANAISDQLISAIERRYPLLQHVKVNRYVDSLGQSLIFLNPKMPPLPYEFKVLKTNEVLSFSTPSGVVYVSLGLLRICTIEGQFVAALSHELAHQKLGHSIEIWRDRMETLRSDPSSTLPERHLWQERLLGPNGLIFYGAGKEREADQVALAIMYNANYDPRAFLSYLQVLAGQEEQEPETMAALLSLHPSSLQRLNWSKLDIVKLPPAKEARLDSRGFSTIQALLKRAAKKKKNRRPIESSRDAAAGT